VQTVKILTDIWPPYNCTIFQSFGNDIRVLDKLNFKIVMKNFFFFSIFIICNIVSLTLSAQFGNIIPGIKDVIKDVTGAATEIIKAPTETVVNVVGVVTGAKKPEDVLDPIKEVAKASGSTLQSAAVVVANTERAIYNKASEYANKAGGDVGDFLFDVGTFSNQFYTELGYSSITVLGNTLKGENPFVIVGAPLAGALRAARDRYDGTAQPLPKDVQEGLKDVFSPEILSRARWAVGNVEITLPVFIFQKEKIFMGDHYAVVVDDIIVFKSNPPTFNDDPCLWAHEMTHVEQYKRWGVEIFAYNYLKDLSKDIEGEANRKCNEFQLKKISQLSGTGILTYPMARIYNSYEQIHFSETLIMQCIFYNDTVPLSYYVTSQGKIIAVNPVDGSSKDVGNTKPPNYIGSLWTLSTPEMNYSVNETGDIITYIKVKSPSGGTLGYQGIKVGHVVKLREKCNN